MEEALNTAIHVINFVNQTNNTGGDMEERSILPYM